jgi:hypothetical protein
VRGRGYAYLVSVIDPLDVMKHLLTCTDAGGARAVSQLKILAELMHRLNFETAEDQKLLPFDVFDMIGGSGSGG